MSTRFKQGLRGTNHFLSDFIQLPLEQSQFLFVPFLQLLEISRDISKYAYMREVIKRWGEELKDDEPKNRPIINPPKTWPEVISESGETTIDSQNDGVEVRFWNLAICQCHHDCCCISTDNNGFAKPKRHG